MHNLDEDCVKNTVIQNCSWISRVMNMEITNAVPDGNNFFSDIFRLNMRVMSDTGYLKDTSMLYKIPPISANKSPKIVKERGLFRIEIDMYTKVLSKLNDLFLSEDPTCDLQWPRFYGMKGDYEGYIMEDLSELGYKMVDRRKELDIEHMKISLEALAKFHAGSAVLIDKGDIAEDNYLYEKFVIFRDRNKTENLFERVIKTLPLVIEQYWPSEWLKYANKLRTSTTGLVNKLEAALNHKNYSFFTLNHGDFWSSNLLFKYSPTGSPEHVRIVDFQLPHINSPCFDIHYLFSCSMKLEMAQRKSDLLKMYHETLVIYLKRFGYVRYIPTLQDLESDFNETRIFGFAASLIFKPLLMNPSAYELEGKCNVLPEGTDKFSLAYSFVGDYYFETMRRTLLDMNNFGFL